MTTCVSDNGNALGAGRRNAMNNDEQLRFNCLSEAVRTFCGTGAQTPDIMAAASKFYEFVKGAEKRDAEAKCQCCGR